MANIKGLYGHNDSSNNNILLCGYGNDIINVDTGVGYGLNISSQNNIEFATILDNTIFQNNADTPKAFNGTSWSKTIIPRMPKSAYIKEFGSRIYLLDVTIPDINKTFESHVFYSDLPKNDIVHMGLEWGTVGATTANANRFRCVGAGFKTYGIKVGDPLFIVSGNQQGEYTVARVSDDQMIETVETFTQTETSIEFWVGGNWFRVRTNNNDVGKWLGENNDQLLIFKQDSLHRRGQPGTPLQRVKGAPGTSSGRSVQNVGNEMTVYFYGADSERTGFYMYQGGTAVRISNAVQPFIDGISASNYGSVVAWVEGATYRAWVGDLSNSNSSNDAYNITISNAVFSFDTITQAWSVDPISDVIKVSTEFRESGAKKVFLGNDSDEIFQTPSGYTFDGEPVGWLAETRIVYPRGSEVSNDFTRVQVISHDAGGVNVLYKLWDTPFGVSSNYQSLGDIKNDKTEFLIPIRNNNACGIQFMFTENSNTENTAVIEKITVFYRPEGTELPEHRSQ